MTLDPSPNHALTPFQSLRACVILAACGVLLGLALRLATPVPPPDAAFKDRIEAWKAMAAARQGIRDPKRGQ